MKLLQTIKKIVPAALFILCFPEVQNVSGQGQANMTDYLSHRFLRFCELVPREEVFVSPDREEYIAGEGLWFNIRLTDRQSSRLSSDSKIVYLELLNAENKPVAQRRISIDKGSGQGQIELPDTLATGIYTIRAYTNRMKNYLPYNCFTKDIKIYNAFSSGSFKNKVYAEDELMPGTGKDYGIHRTNPLLTLKVNYLKPDTLEIIVSADKKYLADNRNLFYLFIQTHGIINHVSSERITDEHTSISVLKKLLIPGINQITVFDFKGQPVCERYIYTPDNGEQALSVHSADSFSTRSKVSLELDIEDSLSAGLNSTDLSISVAPVTDRKEAMELNEYMIFGSEFGLLPGRIIKGRKIDDLPRGLIDSLLLNIKSNWIDWRSVLSDNRPEFKFRVEKEHHYLSGILYTSNHKPARTGEFLLLSTPGKVPAFQYARTNNEGKFSFNIHIGEEVQDLIIQPDNITMNYKISPESSFSDQYMPYEIRIDSISKPVPSYISKMSLNYQVGKIYGSSSAGTPFLTPSVSPLNSKRFYGKPDAEVIMKDWVKLAVMEEVFFEIVPHITLKKRGSVYEMLVVDPFGNILYDVPPVMLIDGVIIKDPAIIANLNPEYVERIDVVKKQYMVGDYLFNGIVNVITMSGDFGNIPLPYYSVRMQYRVFDPVPVFVSPDYSSPEMKNSHEPDFRNTLYWNPSVKPGIDGKVKIEFWTSDIAADYEIKVQGITSEGKPLSIRKIIKVR